MIEVFLDVEIVTSEQDQSNTVVKKAKVLRSEDVSGMPDSDGKVDIIIGNGDDILSLRIDGPELVKVIDFIQGDKNKPPIEPQGSW